MTLSIWAKPLRNKMAPMHYSQTWHKDSHMYLCMPLLLGIPPKLIFFLFLSLVLSFFLSFFLFFSLFLTFKLGGYVSDPSLHENLAGCQNCEQSWCFLSGALGGRRCNDTNCFHRKHMKTQLTMADQFSSFHLDLIPCLEAWNMTHLECRKPV